MNTADITLQPITSSEYPSYKREVIFSCCKWDPQIVDVNSISDHAVILSRQTAASLCRWTESLYAETLECEKILIGRPELWKSLGLPSAIRNALKKSRKTIPDNALHVMRFDFHPAGDSEWALTEVNRDVPGGFAEASVLPQIASRYFNAQAPFKNDAISVLADALNDNSHKEKKIAFVFCTLYTDDLQVIKSIARQLHGKSCSYILIAPDHIRWMPDGPVSIAEGQEGAVGAIARFFPAEWLRFLPSSSGWQGFYEHSVPAANHASAVVTQSKRLPLIWNRLGVENTMWKKLLPETRNPSIALRDKHNEWLLKPAFGRVGEDITVPETMTKKELSKIRWSARLHPGEWIAQKRFIAQKLINSRGVPQYLCVGVFAINGKVCGFYGRIAGRPLIDQYAQDIPILVQGE